VSGGFHGGGFHRGGFPRRAFVGFGLGSYGYYDGYYPYAYNDDYYDDCGCYCPSPRAYPLRLAGSIGPYLRIICCLKRRAGSRRRAFLATAEPSRHSPVIITAAELGNRQSRMKPHGVMPGRLFCIKGSRSGRRFTPATFNRALRRRRSSARLGS
jgi:hypothetical protein